MNNFVENLLTKVGLKEKELAPLRPGMPAPGSERMTCDNKFYREQFKKLSVGENHFLNDCEVVPDPFIGHRIDPKGIVIHFTGSYNAEDTIKWFEEKSLSCHLILDKTGKFYQMVPFNREAEHAGESKWGGYKYLNNFYIGIEVVCLGPLTQKNDKFLDCYTRQYHGAVEAVEFQGYEYWEPFTQLQKERLLEVCDALRKHYRFGTHSVCGHHEASPGRKIDPGGSLGMTMEDFRIALNAYGASGSSLPPITI